MSKSQKAKEKKKKFKSFNVSKNNDSFLKITQNVAEKLQGFTSF